MQELIDLIRAATSGGATTEQKAAGVQACRTIIAALDTEPGKPLVPPSLLATTPAPRPTLDQILDLAIAKLTTIASAHDVAVSPATPKVSPAATQLPPGLRVPATPAALPRGKSAKQLAMKSATTRKA
ncbi:MAG: hypothetical protein SFX73_17820 [Kofleriaceae bacterium]|nr:hypothetical protein [Kofleriaceae bacterium]